MLSRSLKHSHTLFFSLRLLPFTLTPNSIPSIRVSPHRFSSSSSNSWLSLPGNPIIHWPSLPPITQPEPKPAPNPNPKPDPAASDPNFSAIATLFTDPSITPGSVLHSELDRSGIEPDSPLLLAVFDHFDSSPKLLHSLFLWAQKRTGFRPSPKLFDSMVNVLGKSRDFDSAWTLVHDHVNGNQEEGLVSIGTFTILIRRYARAGMPKPAIRTFEFARNNKSIVDSGSETTLFEILMDSLCKEGCVREASEYFHRRKEMDLDWVPSIRVYNIMLNGWFRSRKLKQGERLWTAMKEESVRPSVVTYGTLVEGYCRMRRVEKALEMVGEMTREGIEPNVIVYNPIIDALAEAGRFKEALGMLERFHVLEIGPTDSTYNALIKGFCKAGDLVGASKILKMMISRGFLPSPTTYNYFFRYFSRCGKIDEGMNLYTKMIESGYTPDRLTYHLLVKMLCEEEKLDLAVQVSKEMRHNGYDMDLATSTMLIHLLCKMHRLEEAFVDFEDMIRRGLVPQYLTFQRMNSELKRQGMTEMAQKLCKLMSSVPHSTNLPSTTYGEARDEEHARRKSILRRAKQFSDMLKNCKDPSELDKYKNLSQNVVSSANCLIEGNNRK
ncbi:LOW QUALITY PROTEIN: pentatricopeptide repeat-containing protein At5g11310, mitochondrial-like [Abrus precatorius]|uniref:LOW QUALITY PROTEIN: pentatricopeptide repeat-containing protein At5g11310, mitochondrial-like n=1 Tax=Abrus precatorius TaxID=3816 RepID=A0A8B8JMK4_ABRPR|nr:LOW QUALITY PROTEIN: pentatricopeptide repeat-containing protein At5g11310, mitochondrial-like [Abrus precatorius]